MVLTFYLHVFLKFFSAVLKLLFNILFYELIAFKRVNILISFSNIKFPNLYNFYIHIEYTEFYVYQHYK